MRSLSYLALALLVGGCSQTEKNYVARVKLQKLAEADLYNTEMVTNVIFDAQELPVDSIKNQSRQLFLKGADLYKNKKDPKAAVALFKQSLLVFPDAKTYYELGNALSEGASSKTELNEARKAYGIASDLDFKPVSQLDYNIARVNNLRIRAGEEAGIWEVVGYLRSAYENGFTDSASLLKDNNFSSILNSNEYKTMLGNLKLKEQEPGGLFASFTKSFHTYAQPFEIGLDNMSNGNDRQSISFEYAAYIPEMQNTSFGRDVSHDFFYEGKVAETPAFTAIIYSSISFWGEDMQPIHTKIVTYDKEGKIIASRLFAGQFSAEKIKTGRIENNEITLKDYKRIWEHPIDQVPFNENVVKEYQLVATATFKITETGEIKEVSVPANYSDSVVFAKN